MYLKTEKGCNYNTATKFLQNLKRITFSCIRHGWLLKDPFVGISLAWKEVDRPYLTDAELKNLMEFTSDIDRLVKVRDFFVFSCYTRLAYIDLYKLRKKEIEKNTLGYWIKTRRQKTGGKTSVLLIGVAMQIINKYTVLDDLNDDDHVLRIMSNQKMNAYLKELADVCGITKNLSFHVARYTFATTITLTNGVPIESVSKMLGHKNIKSTQHYARIVDEKVGEDMLKLSQKIGQRLTLAI
jgi:site-specific recombinase XerD